MRVIAGVAGGRRLSSVKGMDTRPTTDRVKESLFNILTPRLTGCCFLDLFAGNGGIGIEALSRGAATVVFIDKAIQCTRMIKSNLQTVGLKGEVYTNDVMKALQILGGKKRKFHIVFLDPPYNQGLVAPIIREIMTQQVLAPQGIIVAEYGRKEEIPIQLSNVSQVRREQYGDTILGFYQVEEDGSEN